MLNNISLLTSSLDWTNNNIRTKYFSDKLRKQILSCKRNINQIYVIMSAINKYLLLLNNISLLTSCIDASVTWPQRPKGAKDKIKMPEGQKAGPKGKKPARRAAN